MIHSARLSLCLVKYLTLAFSTVATKEKSQLFQLCLWFINLNNQYTSHLVFTLQTGDEIEETVHESSRDCG